MKNFFRKLIFVLLISLFLCPFVRAEDNVCGDVPLYLGQYVSPEILLIVDLSGSMAYGLRPDWSPVYSADSDPNTPGEQPYEGFYTDHGLENYVFNRQYNYANSYFVVYPCAQNIDGLMSPFISPQCNTYAFPLSSFANTCLDEVLSSYGIVDWSYHLWYYSNNCLSEDGKPYAEIFSYPYTYYNRPFLYENDTFLLGNYLNNMRIEVVTRTIKNLVQDSSLAFGLGFFKSSFGSQNDYTIIYTGVEPYSTDHVNELINTLDNIAHEPIENCDNCYRINVGGGTPFSPSIVAARKYFEGLKTDQKGNFYSPEPCAKKFVIFLTDGVGNIDSTVDNVRTRTKELVQAGIIPIAVGFNLPPSQDEQLRAMAEVANQYADGINTFALHQDSDGDGNPDPFIARNPQELAETLRSIMLQIKQTVFRSGAATARKTEEGGMVIWTSFDVTDWTGEVRTGHFVYNCANCHTPEDVRNLARWNFYNDIDGDGHLDLINEDIDGDHHLDVNEDKNGNGQLDPGEDIDGDGHLDVAEDVDGDGHLDEPEPINWTALKQFLSDQDRIRSKMGYHALKGYDSSKLDAIISMLQDDSGSNDSEWWAIEDGWSSSQTLTCGNSGTRNIKYGDYMADFRGSIGLLSEDEVSFIRGEKGCRTQGGTFRVRNRPLGDIIFSQPRVWNNLIWVTANDGMLHAFDVNTGQEKFAYIPQAVLDKYLSVGYWNIGYCHAFLFDGTPVIQETDSNTVLIAGLGRGGSHYIALNITGAPDQVDFLWDFTDTDLGLATNPPKLVKCGDNDWRAIITSGPPVDNDWTNKKAYIYSVGLNNGMLMAKKNIGDDVGNMPSVPVAVDINNDRSLDFLYLGDLKGRLWRISGCDFSSSCQLLDLGSDHPITASPVTTVSKGKVWVFFGTGKYQNISDLSDDNVQFLIGFLDDPTACTIPTLTEIGLTLSGDYLLPSNVCAQTYSGWEIRLRNGERVITPPIVIGGTVFFLTFLPTGDECSGGGDTWLYALDYNRGCSAAPKIDINGDGKVDQNDKIDGKVPVAIRIGQGVPTSPPAIVGPSLMRITTTDNIKNIIFSTKNVWVQPGSWTDVDVPYH